MFMRGSSAATQPRGARGRFIKKEDALQFRPNGQLIVEPYYSQRDWVWQEPTIKRFRRLDVRNLDRPNPWPGRLLWLAGSAFAMYAAAHLGYHGTLF